MGEVHYLPGVREGAARMLARAAEEAIAAHPDPRVATRWAAMARETLARWPGPPPPTVAELELELGDALDEAGRREVLEALAGWTESYYADVHRQVTAMHREILSLQRRVAERETADGDGPTGR